jgi:putative spermidine/putrescine transport system substrate-binding protein
MKKKISLAFIFLLILSACSQQPDAEVVHLANKDWDDIQALAEGENVRIYMWGGDEGVNSYIDDWVAPQLLENAGVALERVPIDTNEILQKLLNEKKANKEKGTIDLIWINGENFRNAKTNELLYGPFTDQLPNYTSFLKQDRLDLQYDFGTEINGYEAPWGKVQFVFFYDSAKVSNPPTSFEELQNWLKEHPGRFTYPDASDFTGNAFLRHVLYKSAGGPEPLLENGYSEALAEQNSDWMWGYLNDIEKDLWREGATYPASLTELDRLYTQGEVWMTMGYNEARAESLIEEGVFPKTTKSFVLESGSIGNTHYLAIPFNSPNKAAALVAANFLLSPDAQFAKYDSTYWGENMSLDKELLPAETQAQIDSYDRGTSVLPQRVLDESFLPEMDSQYVNWIEENWIHEVVQTK